MHSISLRFNIHAVNWIYLVSFESEHFEFEMVFKKTSLNFGKLTGHWTRGAAPCCIHAGERLKLDLRLSDQLHIVLGSKFWQHFLFLEKVQQTSFSQCCTNRLLVALVRCFFYLHTSVHVACSPPLSWKQRTV